MLFSVSNHGDIVILVIYFNFFSPAICWNFSVGILDFHKDSHINRWFSKSVFSRVSHHGQEELESVHRSLHGPPLHPRSVCLLPDTEVCETPVRIHWSVVLDSTSATKSLLSMDECQVFVEVEIWTRYVLFTYLATVSPNSNCFESFIVISCVCILCEIA